MFVECCGVIFLCARYDIVVDHVVCVIFCDSRSLLIKCETSNVLWLPFMCVFYRHGFAIWSGVQAQLLESHGSFLFLASIFVKRVLIVLTCSCVFVIKQRLTLSFCMPLLVACMFRRCVVAV